MVCGWETTADNVQGKLPQMIKDAGFQAQENYLCQTIVGNISVFVARKIESKL